MPSPQSTVRYVVRLFFSGAPELSKYRSNCLLAFETLLSRAQVIPNGRESFHFVVGKGAIEDGNATDPRGKSWLSIAVDDTSNSKRPALLSSHGLELGHIFPGSTFKRKPKLRRVAKSSIVLFMVGKISSFFFSFSTWFHFLYPASLSLMV